MKLGFDLSGSSAVEARRMSANGMDRLAQLAIRQNYPMRQGFAKSVGLFPFFAGGGVIIQRISVLRNEECISVDYWILAGGGFPEDIHNKLNELIILQPGEGKCEIERDISHEIWQLSRLKEAIWVPIPAGFPFSLKAIESFCCTILYGIR